MQLPPVRARPAYSEYKSDWLNFPTLWELVKIAELTEVMRQCDDAEFIDLLNHIPVAELNNCDLEILKSSSVISTSSVNYPRDVLHIFAEDAAAAAHKTAMLQSNINELHGTEAIDILPKNIPPTKIAKALNCHQSETREPASILKVKLNARIMLTANTDLQDRLINGQIRTIKHISKDRTNNITKLYVKFDDAKAGLKKVSNDFFAKQNSWVPTEKAESNIKIPSKSGVPTVFKRAQFPLMPAWTCAVHKVQSLTLEEIVVNLDLLKQKQFNYGQMYVALSRVTSLRGLHFTGEFKAAAIR